MKSTRFLLPFTQGINLNALACAVQFAEIHQAILVPLALIPLSEHEWAHGPRLEAIEQANDFLEAVKYQAARAKVKIEPCDMQTLDVVRSISVFAQEMMCERILLFLRDGTPVLLPPEVVKRLLERHSCTLCLFRLPRASRTKSVWRLLQHGFDRIRTILGHWEEGHTVRAFEKTTLSRKDGATQVDREGKTLYVKPFWDQFGVRKTINASEEKGYAFNLA